MDDIVLNLTRYETRLNTYNYGEKDYYIEQNKQLILNGFNTHPSYQLVTVNGENRDVHIVDDNTLTKEPNRKQLLSKPNETLNVGDYVVWDNYNWLVVNIDNNKDIQHRCEIYRCNGLLNWIDDVGVIRSYPCVRQELARASSGSSENKNITIPDKLNSALVQNNEYTNNIRERNGTRFIFGEKSFSTRDTDREIIDGLVVISFEEDEINFDTDKYVDLGNGTFGWVADYTKAPVYSIEIDQSDSEVITGDTIQLTAQITKDGQVVNENIVWASDNESVATVDSSGLVTSLTDGVVNITASIEGNVGIDDSIQITCSASVSDNYSIYVSPDSTSITLTDTLIVETTLLNNGEELLDTFTYSVIGGTASSDQYNFTVVSGNSFSIENLKENGTVIVRCQSGVYVKDLTYELDYLW